MAIILPAEGLVRNTQMVTTLASLGGLVTGDAAGTPLEGVTVTLNKTGGSYTETTDMFGYYDFRVPPGTYTSLVFSKTGYDTQTITD
jgi:hypothetical protein